jgi:hypothetical protein
MLGPHLGMRDLRARTIDVSWQLARIPYADRDAGTFRVPEGYESRHLYKTLHLVRTKTAAGQRIIPIVGFMWDALVEWQTRNVPSPYGLVWPSMATGPRIPAGRPMTSREDTEAWWALQDRAQTACVVGTQGRRWLLHEARHSAATTATRCGRGPARRSRREREGSPRLETGGQPPPTATAFPLLQLLC